MSTAAASVLHLPELLSMIFDHLYGDSRTLLSCMLVNKYWSELAVNILWKQCGAGCHLLYRQDSTLEDQHLAPQIRDLVAIASEPNRVGWYARCIDTLCFDIEYPDDDEDCDDWPKDESRFHSVLEAINFPSLAHVFLRPSQRGVHFNTTSSLIQYLQPKLRTFRLDSGSITDLFLTKMSVRHSSNFVSLSLTSFRTV